jgi:peptidoglycan/LPS O-acetylase OafA/YrhL
VTIAGDVVSRAWLATGVGFFALVNRSARLRALLASRGLLQVGFASYPLYLLHNELGIGFINSAAQWLPTPLWPLLPWATMAGMIPAAWLIARWFDLPATAWLRAVLLQAVLRGRLRPAPPPADQGRVRRRSHRP